MLLEILTPETTIFSSEVDSVVVPGVQGEFQILNNHASIVSLLSEGLVKIHTHLQEHLEFDLLHATIKKSIDDEKVLTFKIDRGTVEVRENKVTILSD